MVDPHKLKIILHDDLRDNPLSVLRDLFLFFKISDDFIPQLSDVNQAGVLKHRWLTDRLIPIWYKYRVIRHKLGIHNVTFLKKMFIDVSANKVTELKHASSKTKMSIIEHHLSDIVQLEQLIDRDLSHWKII